MSLGKTLLEFFVDRTIKSIEELTNKMAALDTQVARLKAVNDKLTADIQTLAAEVANLKANQGNGEPVDTTALDAEITTLEATTNGLLDTVNPPTLPQTPVASITADPASVPAGGTNGPIDITGVNTNFSQVSPVSSGPQTFAMAGKGGAGAPPLGASIISTVVDSKTTAVLTINAPTLATKDWSIVDTASGAFVAMEAV